jgi:flagellar protein FliS
MTAIDNNDLETAHNNIRKVERIITEFDTSLDDRFEVSQDFHNVYHYLQSRLRDANVKKDKEVLEEVLKHLRTMRDTWKEVMQITQNGKKTQVS